MLNLKRKYLWLADKRNDWYSHIEVQLPSPSNRMLEISLRKTNKMEFDSNLEEMDIQSLRLSTQINWSVAIAPSIKKNGLLALNGKGRAEK